MKKLIILCFLIVTIFTSNAQKNYFSTIKFNVSLDDRAVTNSGGLEVKGSLESTKPVSEYKASLSGKPSENLEKKLFILFITITNTGQNDIVISNWEFQAICPENALGKQWQDQSFVNLITPVIPQAINVILKPGEKKSFYTGETDFFWCSPKHKKALLTPPCGFTALINCKQVGSKIYNNGLDNEFSGNNCTYLNYDEKQADIDHKVGGTIKSKKSDNKGGSVKKKQEVLSLDPELLKLIDDFNKAQEAGNTSEASEIKNTIIEISGHAYPDQIDQITALLQEKTLKPKTIATINSTSTKIAPTNNLDFSDWLTIKNPYYAMQIRYKLEKQEGTIGYFRAQMRIDFDDNERCKETRCLGYAVSFGYPKPDNESNFTYLNFKFYYSYINIYTIPDLIPINLSLPDGSKRMLKKDGFYLTTKSNPNETDLRYYFDKAVDLITNGSPIKCNNFIESKALILK